MTSLLQKLTRLGYPALGIADEAPKVPSHPTAEILAMPDAEVILYRDFFSQSESDACFQELYRNIHWKQEAIMVFGKVINQPRLTAWHGEEGAVYAYSGISLTPNPWTPALLEIKQRIEKVAEVQFNSVLLNLYRNECDSVGWHSDAEPELGINPVIGSASFGAIRSFQFRHKRSSKLYKTVDLTHGSLLLMRGSTQHHWRHRLPRSAKPHGPRINLTFRVIK
jgi:alkylated DNA repair dioxygenase AlkB